MVNITWHLSYVPPKNMQTGTIARLAIKSAIKFKIYGRNVYYYNSTNDLLNL